MTAGGPSARSISMAPWKWPEPLPEAVVPFAERLFAWFPEVLVSLGSPDLHELFDLPPMPGAQMRLEETGEHKLVQVRLGRRSSDRVASNSEGGSQAAAGSKGGSLAAGAGSHDGRRGVKVREDLRLQQQYDQQRYQQHQQHQHRLLPESFTDPLIDSAASRRNLKLFSAEGSHDSVSPKLPSPRSHDPGDQRESGSIRMNSKPSGAPESAAQSVVPDGGCEPAVGSQQGASEPLSKNVEHNLAKAAGAAATPAAPPRAPAIVPGQRQPPLPPQDFDARRTQQNLKTENVERAEGADVIADSAPATSLRPLRNRRGLAININDTWRRKDEPKSSSSDLLTPKVEPPAVLRGSTPDMNVVQTSKRMLHPLPGAFSNTRTLIFFDWDDTLCPTSWIRRTLKDHMSDQWEWAVGDNDATMDWHHQIPAWFGQPLPDLPDVRDAIQSLQRAVIDMISVAQSLGVVCIVTNAVDGWVDKTTRKWLPQLKQYILGHGARPPITVLYGQQLYERPPSGSAAANLGWVDGLGELMWWKKAAMLAALERIDDLYRVDPIAGRCRDGPAGSLSAAPAQAEGQPNARATAPDDSETLPCVPWQADHGAKHLVNVVSIGDSEAEMQASHMAALAHHESSADLGSSADRGRSSAGTASSAAARRRPLSAPAGGQLPGQPWVKNLKFWEGPSVDQIIEQLNLVRRALPQVVATRSHLRLGPEDLQNLLAGLGTGSSEDAEASLQRFLRTQTV